MRLIHIPTLKLHEFFESEIPEYAILSHRWGSEELTFKEVMKDRVDKSKSGYQKLINAARAAARYDVSYLWVDTCCIDKRSSAELSEAINSMFSWYQKAKICLAFLEDVTSGPNLDISFRNSIWFTRSWTLQELLAPEEVEFFDGDWIRIGCRNEFSPMIEEITGIPMYYWDESDSLEDFSIAQKMSWAANRTATRSEDIAYSLMGIFDVNMPLLYGEGRKAFIRLQEEIIRRTTDLSFLACGSDSTDSLLARSPADFQLCNNIFSTIARWPVAKTPNTAFNLTNRGLEIESNFVRWDLGRYGLLIGEGFGKTNFDYVLLLRRSIYWKDVMYRVGLRKLANPYELRRPSPLFGIHRRVTLLFTPEREDSFIRSIITCAPDFGIDILPESSLTIRSVTIHYPMNYEKLKKYVVRHRGNSSFECTFDNPMRTSFSRMVCNFGENRDVIIDLSFDFDSSPCALIYQEDEEREVWEVSETIEGDDMKLMWKPEKREMDRTLNLKTGHRAAFLRGLLRGKEYAAIPKDLIPNQEQVWVAFISPYFRKKPRWSFKISRGVPTEWSEWYDR